MNYRLFLLGCLATLAVVSCKKVEGCMDADATNYNVEAEKDDGSCTYNYSGEISFWFNESRSNDLVFSGVTSLTVYFDDVSVGTIDPSEWAVGPECNGENRFTTTVALGNAKFKNVEYVINDQTGSTRFSGFVTALANECESSKLP